MGLAFASPLLLWGLVALPVLWFLLRAVPPAPIRRRFPGVALLLGLVDQDRQADKTPWWLMALRMAAIALVILGFAGPVLNPQPRESSDKPLLVLVDGGWAEAQDWAARMQQAADLMAQIEAMQPSEELYDAKVSVLQEMIEHHVEEEEKEYFQQVQKTEMDLQAVGEQMAARKDELMSQMDGEIPSTH